VPRLLLVCLLASVAWCAEPTAPERGKKALESTAFIKAFWPKQGYDNVWKVWGLKEKPKEYSAAVSERYGLHTAPYENMTYPMGLRQAPLLLGQGVGIDCMTCHGGSINGKSIVGLGNSTLDIHALFEEMSEAGGNIVKVPFSFSNARGTNEAGAFAVYLLGLRTPELKLKADQTDLGLKDDSCEDVPAWWLLKKKKTMYHVGATDTKSVRSLMQFLLHPLNTPDDFKKHEATFADIRQYVLSIEAPKYPYKIDTVLAKKGQAVFESTCSKCHGTYDDQPTYPNKIVAIDDIGTDRTRFDNIGTKFNEAYNASWFAKDDHGGIAETKGYQAPPLDGIWATAPYFHNGSVPTLEGVLNSKLRPKVFTRSFKTDEADYDKERVGWKITDVKAPDKTASAFEQRKVYDTTRRGRGNGGHTYGDALKDEERQALIEYLKTL
jgi:Cytochrome c